MLPAGTDVDLYSVAAGVLQFDVMTYGGIITSLRVPDRDGSLGNVVLGHSSLASYLHNPAYLGALVGRYANRIARGRFALGGSTFRLAVNDGPNHLHGGIEGFDRKLWTAVPFSGAGHAGVRLSRISPAGEEGYPGTLQVAVTYSGWSDGRVELHYEAATDAPTIVNLTQHTYFNLAGEGHPDALRQQLTIVADGYTPVTEGLIPTGEIAPVDGSPFDFRVPARLAERIGAAHAQLRLAGGFDHNFVLAPRRTPSAPVARLRDPASGRSLEVATTEPGLQFYDGHLLGGRVAGAYDGVFARHAGVCLETQHFPDSPNQPRFPPVVLLPGARFSSTTTWRFTAA